MRELEELIRRTISTLEDKLKSLEDESAEDSRKIDSLNIKIKSQTKRRKELSLALSECQSKLDYLEKFYYSIDKLEDIRSTYTRIIADDLDRIDKIDSILDGKRDAWKTDVELARFYLMHEEAVEAKGLSLAVAKVKAIYDSIRGTEDQIGKEEELHIGIEEYQKGVDTATKTIKEYRRAVREHKIELDKRKKEQEKVSTAIETLRRVNPNEVITLNTKLMEELRPVFSSDEEYLEFLKEIVKNNSGLLRQNTRLEKYILSVKEQLDNASTIEEKESLSELYLLLLYCKNGKDKDDFILEYIESTDYNVIDGSDLLKIVEIDAEHALNDSRAKLKKLFSLSNIKELKGESFSKYSVIKSSIEEIKKESRIPRIAKYLVLEDKESIDALYNYIILRNVYNHLKRKVLEELGESFSESDDEYLREFSVVLKEIVRNKYDYNIGENDINDYDDIEAKILYVNSVDREEMLKATTNEGIKKEIVEYKIYDEEGHIDMSKIKDILLDYKRKELVIVKDKADIGSGFKKSLVILLETISEDIDKEFIDDFVLTDLKDEKKVTELLRNHIYDVVEKRKKIIKGTDDAEEQISLYEEALLLSHSEYLDTFERMKKEVFESHDKNYEGFKNFLGKVMMKVVEDDLRDKTDSTDFIRELTLYIKDTTEAGHSDYRVYDYLHEYIASLETIDIYGIETKEELFEEVKGKMPSELKSLLASNQDESGKVARVRG